MGGTVMNFNELNLNCLKEIEYEASNNIRRVELRENITHLTDDMGDVIDYVAAQSRTMRFQYPAFHSEYSFWFSHDNRLYIIITISDNITIQVDSFMGTEEEDEIYTFKEFLEDYDAYYYLDLETMTVKSLWDNKEYIIKEKV